MSASDDTRQKIIEAAGTVFAEKGFQAATVREICAAASVNLASVNYYFGDKETLYVETVRQARVRRAAEVPMPLWAPGTSPEARLRDFVRTLLNRMLDDDPAGWETRLMTREVIQPTSACREMVEDYFQPHFQMLLEILDELVPTEMPLPKRRQIGFSIIGQCVFYRVAGGVVGMLTPADELQQHFRPPELAEHIASWSLQALRASSRCAPSLSGQRREAR